MQALKTGILNDTRMLLHKSKKSHPQKPQRVESIMKELQSTGYLDHPRIDFVASLQRKATDQELQLVYPAKYVKYVSKLWPQQSHRRDLTVLDTYFCEYSEEASRLAVGACLQGADNIMSGKWGNAFAVVRPPGHHSGARNTLNGFCIFNNVAITAKYLRQKHGVKKIAIFDWDIHCGDGTHEIFSKDPSVLFISIHRYDNGCYYPSGEIGSFTSSGYDEGEGFNVNIPLNFLDKNFKPYPTQPPGDNEYIYTYERVVEPILKEFQPDFILVSSGFDASRQDPLGGFTVTPNGFYYMAKRLTTLGIPMLAVLQGGYNVHQTALDCVAVVKGLLEEEQFPESLPNLPLHKLSTFCHLHQNHHKDIDEIIEFHSKTWKSLQTPQLLEFTNKIKANKEKVFGIVDTDNSESSSSSQKSQEAEETAPQTPADNRTELPKRSASEKKPKKDQEEKKSASLQKKQVTAVPHDDSEQEGTNQFYFVVGHMQRFKNFSVNNDKLLKWAYQHETQFYESNFPETKFAPKYFGKEGEYIVLENLLYQQKEHIVADFKMSRHSKKPGISARRAEKELQKEASSTSGKYGFRLCGFTTPTYKQGGLLVTDESFLQKVLKKVVTSENKAYFCDFLSQLAHTIKGVNRTYYNTSIFLARGKDKSEIRWIDFHYWFDNCSSYDENLVQGLDNLRQFIEKVDTSSSL